MRAKRFAGSGIKNGNMSDQQLAEEIHELIMTKLKKRKLQSLFIDNIWGADLE